MNWIQGLILGLIQGLTEYLPISSKSHIELGRVLLSLPNDKNLTFTVLLHGATVLSTLVVFRKDIVKLIKGFFTFSRFNQDSLYVWKIIISMIPVGIIGLLYKEKIESLFTGNLLLIGPMMLVTALLLTTGHFRKTRNREIGFIDSLIIGIAQALAVLPGISRSGSTIATGLILGIKKETLAKFSFLMVILPILGENIRDLVKGDFTSNLHMSAAPMIVGFIAAFISGLFACRWMINLVKNKKLIYFAIYCFIVGIVCIGFGMMK